MKNVKIIRAQTEQVMAVGYKLTENEVRVLLSVINRLKWNEDHYIDIVHTNKKYKVIRKK